jgi:hypothetical protein
VRSNLSSRIAVDFSRRRGVGRGTMHQAGVGRLE